MTESIREQKSLYRKQIKQALGKVSSEEVALQSQDITKRAISLDAFKAAGAISIFLSMPHREISTNDIVLRALEDGKKVFVPYIHASKYSKSKTMDMLRLRDKDDLNSLQPDAWGIPSLSAESVADRENALGGIGCFEDSDEAVAGSSRLDLIFMPAMAFDTSYSRLGHGKGFYDRYLTRYRQISLAKYPASEMPYLVGLALREQLLPDGDMLPTTEDDWKVDTVVVANS